MKQVIKVTRLNFACEVNDCMSAAAFTVDYKEEGTFPYSCGHYCRLHMPDNARSLWNAMAQVREAVLP